MEASSRSILVEDVNDGDEDTFGVETDTEADFDFDEPEEITDDFLDELSPYASTTNFDFGASATSAAFENYNMSAAGTALVDNNASTDFDFLSDPVPGGTENGNGPAAGLEAPSAAGGGDNALDAFGDGIGDAATPDAAPVGRGLFGTLGRMGRMVVNGAGGGRSANDQSPPDLLDMDSGADDPNGTTGQQFQVDLAGGMAVQSDSTDNGSNDVDPFDGIAAGETGEPQTPSGGGLFGTLGRMGRMVVNSAGKTNGNDDDPTPHDLLDDDGGFPPDRFDDEAEQQQGGPEGSAGADSDAPTQQAAGGLFGTLGRMGGRVGGRIFRSRSPEQVDPSGDNDLDADGNSLPHPGSLESNNSNVVNPMGDSGDLSNLGGQGNSLPHPEALMRQSNAAPPAADTGNVSGNNDDAILDVNGNSLPHPDAMNPDSLAISKEDENLDILHGVGNSLPHPEALMRQSNSSARDFGNNDGENDDAILDVDGNSLPHPDTMKSKNVVNGKDDENLDILGGNGNSLPHPETLMRKSIKTIEGTNNGDNTDNDDAILDVDGNSLPHPDTMKSKNVANGKDDENLDILGGNGNSLPHPETLMRKSIKTIEGTNNGDNTDNDDAILDVDGNSLPHPDTMKSKNVANGKGEEDLENLDGNGNSLPHPETLMRKAKAASPDNGNEDGNNDAILDENGNSLPHPDAMKSKNVANGKGEEDLENLDGNGNSLPHPETLKENYPVTMLQKIRAFAAGESGDNDESILDENGSSLPNPDVMKSRSGSNSEEDEDLENLDGNGNSLPHPDTLMRQSKDKALAATREICADGYNDNDNASENGDIILDDNGNSLPHPDTLRGMTSTDNLLADIESATNAQDNKSSNNNVEDCSSNGEDRLDCGGNSLPHPDTIKASATSVRRRTASSLFGNIRRSVMSTLPGISILNYSEIETPTSQDQDDFRDEENAVDDMNAVASRSTLDAALLRQSDENRNALQHSGASFRDSSSRSIFTIDDSIESNFISDSNSLSTFGGMSRMSIGRSTGKLLDANGSSLPSQEEGASSGSASKHSSRRLRELGQSFLSTLNARASSSSLRSNGAAQREQEEFNFEDNAYIEGDAGIDEEYGRKSGTWHSNRDVEFDNNGFPVAYRVDRFDDERSRGEKDSSNSSRKERIQKLFKEQTERFQDQRYSWRLGCLLFAVFLIFLGMLIPLITLARERRQRIAVTAPPVATAPTESPIIETIGYDVDCDDEIDLVDENGKKVGDESNSIVTLSGNSDIVACYTTEQPIMFRFKRCRPSSLDFTGVFPLGSLFMDQLWQPYYAASYLCGEQPCPSGGANPPITKVMTGPPIAKPGDYRIFLVKESLWPYEYSVYTPLFRVVEDGQECPIPDDQIVTPVPVN